MSLEIAEFLLTGCGVVVAFGGVAAFRRTKVRAMARPDRPNDCEDFTLAADSNGQLHLRRIDDGSPIPSHRARHLHPFGWGGFERGFGEGGCGVGSSSDYGPADGSPCDGGSFDGGSFDGGSFDGGSDSCGGHS
jgi:hypothetical protein